MKELAIILALAIGGCTASQYAAMRTGNRLTLTDTECPVSDASDWCVGADRDGLGDWQEVQNENQGGR